MGDSANLVRICVALTARTCLRYDGDERRRRDYHPDHEHHWSLRVEVSPQSNKWQQYHTLESRAWQQTQRGGQPEDFEDFPTMNYKETAEPELQIAAVPYSRRAKLIAALEDRAIEFVKRQRRCGQSCRFFVEQALVWLHDNREVFPVRYPRQTRCPAKYSDVPDIDTVFNPALLKMQVRQQLMGGRDAATQPIEAPPKLRSKRSFWSVRSSDKEKSATSSKMPPPSKVTGEPTLQKSESKSRSGSRQRQPNVVISGPRPVSGEELAKVIQEQNMRLQRETKSNDKFSTSGLFRSEKQRPPNDPRGENRPPRRASENPKSSMRMLGALDPRGMRNRNSSPR